MNATCINPSKVSIFSQFTFLCQLNYWTRMSLLGQSLFLCQPKTIEGKCYFRLVFIFVSLEPLKAKVWVTAAPHSWAVTAAPDLTEEKGGEEGWDQESRMESGTLCEGFVGWHGGDIRALKMSSGWRRIGMGYIRNPQKGFYREFMEGSMKWWSIRADLRLMITFCWF